MDAYDSEAGYKVKLRIAVCLILIVVGALLVVLTDDIKTGKMLVLQKVGLALMVAGVVSILTEVFLKSRTPPVRPPDYSRRTGIQMLSLVRQGDDRYQAWVTVTERQELFFAGRSVLHRIQYDFDERRLPLLEDILWRKLAEGTRIQILFCNPLWEQVECLADGEGQPREKTVGGSSDEREKSLRYCMPS